MSPLACPQNTDAWNSFLFGEPVDDGSSLLLANNTNSSSDAIVTDDGSLQPLALPEEGEYICSSIEHAS